MRALDGVVGRDGRVVADLKRDRLVILQKAGTDLRALGVEHDGNRNAKLLGNGADALDVLAVILMRTMAEIEAGHVHAVLDDLAQDIIVVGRRTHCADNLGSLLHVRLSLHSWCPHRADTFCTVWCVSTTFVFFHRS